MKLENLRNNEIGNIGFRLSNSGYKEIVLFQHCKMVNGLMLDVFRHLKELENPRNNMIFKNNISCLKLVSLVFICLECYANDVLKMICKTDKDTFLQYKGKKLNERLQAIIKIGGYTEEEKIAFYRCGCFQLLQEFEEYRNIVFHGGFYAEKNFCKTSFSNNPQNCNIIDVLQALKILIDIFYCFRFIVHEKDIMPQSIINYSEKLYF